MRRLPDEPWSHSSPNAAPASAPAASEGVNRRSGRAAGHGRHRRQRPNEHQRRQNDRRERMPEQELGEILAVAEHLWEDNRDQPNDQKDKRRRDEPAPVRRASAVRPCDHPDERD